MPRRLDWHEVKCPEPAPVDDPRVKAALDSAIRAKAKTIVREARLDARGIPDPDPKAVAEELEINLVRECPVCRSLAPCQCTEPERSFIRRTKFIPDLKGLARCPRCSGPLSTIYVPRRGTKREDLSELSVHGAIHGCVICHGPALASVVAAISDRYNQES